MVIWFTTEFLLRIWSAGCRSRYQQVSGRLQFIRRPLCIVGKTVSHRWRTVIITLHKNKNIIHVNIYGMVSSRVHL